MQIFPWLVNSKQDLDSLLKELKDLLLHKVAFSIAYEEPNLVIVTEEREEK